MKSKKPKSGKTGYWKKVARCGDKIIQITKCMMPTLGRHKKREKKQMPTSEKKKRQNLRRCAENLFYLLLANFFPNDFFIAFTYPAGTVQSPKQGKEIFKKFIRLYTAYCRKNGYKPDYIYNTEVGKRGAVHHHAVLHRHVLMKIDGNEIDDLQVIEQLWRSVSGGSVQYGHRLWKNYDWYGLAVYMTDRTKGGEQPDTHVKGERRYNAAHGMNRPEITYERIDADRWYSPRAPKGWFVDKDSIRSGADELTGGNFIKYIIRRE